jgi:hypothetical protein
MSLHETSIGNLFLAAISPSISLHALSPLRFLFRMQRCIWIQMATFQYGYILCVADLQIDDFQVLEGVRCFVAYINTTMSNASWEMDARLETIFF